MNNNQYSNNQINPLISDLLSIKQTKESDQISVLQKQLEEEKYNRKRDFFVYVVFLIIMLDTIMYIAKDICFLLIFLELIALCVLSKHLDIPWCYRYFNDLVKWGKGLIEDKLKK